MSNIEDHIRRAMEEGKFDDLPGKGKPLKLEDDALTDPEWRLAHHMLRSSGFTLPWIERRQEIERRMESRGAGSEALAGRGARKRFPAGMRIIPISRLNGERQSIYSWSGCGAINQEIRSYNLEVPSERFQLRPVDSQRELNLISAGASGTLQDTNPGL